VLPKDEKKKQKRRGLCTTNTCVGIAVCSALYRVLTPGKKTKTGDKAGEVTGSVLLGFMRNYRYLPLPALWAGLGCERDAFVYVYACVLHGVFLADA
jgi:hypothetical protein